MKRLHRIALSLCLSLLRCVTCSSLFSVKAFAYEVPYNAYLFKNSNDDNMSFRIYGTSDVNATNTPYGSGRNNVHFVNVGAVDSARGVRFGFANTGVFEFPFDFEHYNYYVALTVVSTLSGTSFPAVPTTMTLGYYEYGDLVSNFHIPIVATQLAGSSNSSGFTVTGAIPDDFPSSFIRYIYARGFSTEFDVSASDYTVSAVIYEFPDNVGYGDVVTAIYNQTDDILNKMDEVLTPEGENNLGESVDQITDQVQENLGALGFAHDTVENFIGLFNEEPPAPVINVPPLKMKIKGVEHQFFNGYQYDFRSMEEGGLSVLVGAVRTAGTLVLWWAFLQYCLKEFDGFFRR